MGLETRACINGLNKTDFENVKKIPTLETETDEMKNETIPALDERVTALEQGGGSSDNYSDKIISHGYNNLSKKFLSDFKYLIPMEVFENMSSSENYNDEVFEFTFDSSTMEVTGTTKKDIVLCLSRLTDREIITGYKGNIVYSILFKKGIDFTQFMDINIELGSISANANIGDVGSTPYYTLILNNLGKSIFDNRYNLSIGIISPINNGLTGQLEYKKDTNLNRRDSYFYIENSQINGEIGYFISEDVYDVGEFPD